MQTHDVHHPIAVEDYYEDQKEEAIKRAKSYRANRLPKFLAHFQNVLQSNPDSKNNGGTYLVGSITTTADLVLFQV
jgi:glutathione S-transferase